MTKDGSLPSRPSTLGLWIATSFVGALLVFVVQPIAGKVLLPGFGGTPTVWTTCVLFFQLVLLAAYGYVHVTKTWLGVRRQAVLQLALMLVGVACLPAWLRFEIPADASATGSLGIVGILAQTLGAPFFLLASTAPLVQTWLVRTRGRTGVDPYPLYAASNAGSLLALLSYPLIVEPSLGLGAQRQAWAVGYGIWIVLVGACAWWLRRGDAPPAEEHAATPPLRWSTRFSWVALAFVPSSLMLGVTSYVTTDVAPVPLLWVAPLGIYLASFIVVFARGGFPGHAVICRTLPVVLLPVLPALIFDVSRPLTIVVVVHFIALGWACLAFHGEIARTRPPPARLTELYVWLAVGGALGGAFNVAAPWLFDDLVEYPLTLVLAALVLPRAASGERRLPSRWHFALGSAAALGLFALESVNPINDSRIGYGPFALLVVVFVFGHRRPRILGGLLAVLLVVGVSFDRRARAATHRERSFYAAYRVSNDEARNLRLLVHGNTVHGAESFDARYRDWGLPYFIPDSPIGRLLRSEGPRRAEPLAVLGLGVGALAPYVAPGQRATFYEVDPVAARIAKQHFTALSRCPGECNVIVGDGRLEIAKAEDGAYGVIVVDAFLSGSIPTHLYNREAVALYFRKLRPGGLVVFNVSNRYLDLKPMLAAIARDLDLAAAFEAHAPTAQQRQELFASRTTWVVMARQRDELALLGWRELVADASTRAWTDEYSNVLGLYAER